MLITAFAQPVFSETAEPGIEQAALLSQRGEALYQQGKYQEALPLLQNALSIRGKFLDTENVDMLESINNLAVLYRTLGQYEKSILLFQRALAISEKIHGSDSAETGTVLNNFGALYNVIGQYDKAEPLYQRALAIREKILGPEHASTAASLNNLGGLYFTIGQYDKAMPLYQRALAIDEKTLGPYHADTALILSSLAMLYERLGQYEKALPLLQRALVINEKSHGKNQADTAIILNNLAMVYQTLGQFDNALPLYQRALAIFEETLGSDQYYTATCLNNLGELYRTLGQYDKALPLHQRSLAINERIFGLENADTARSLNNLALLYMALGQHDVALPLFQRAYRSAQSTSVPDTLKIVQGNLGYYYTTQGSPATAIFFLKSTVNTMQGLRADSRGLDKGLQNSLLKKNEDIYKYLADLLVDEGRLPEAQQVLSMLKEDEYFDFISRDVQADVRGTRMSYSGAERHLIGQLDKLGNDGVALIDKLNVLNKQEKFGLTPEQEKQRKKIKAQLAEQTKQTIALLNDLPRGFARSNLIR